MFGRGRVGAGVLVYEFPLSMFAASDRVVSISCVWVLCPYAWVKVVFRVLWMCVALVLFSLLLGICVGCI